MGAKREQEVVFLTVALHGVGHHLLHHIPFPMGCRQGGHEEEDARYSYVHLTRSNLQEKQGAS